MKFFIDTADIQEIEELLPTGFVDGVTTNPSLIAKVGRPVKKVIADICALVKGPVSAEVTAMDHFNMLKEGRELASIAPNVAVKVPLTPDGLLTCKELSKRGVMVNVTLVFSALQALLAAKAGATFVSPFMGRLDDIGQSGSELIEDICEIFYNYEDIETEVLAASIRTPQHLQAAAEAGADIATIPPKLLKQLYHHPLTDKGLEIFLKDAAAVGLKIL